MGNTFVQKLIGLSKLVRFYMFAFGLGQCGTKFLGEKLARPLPL